MVLAQPPPWMGTQSHRSYKSPYSAASAGPGFFRWLSACWPPRVTDGTHMTFCRTLPSLCVFLLYTKNPSSQRACLLHLSVRATLTHCLPRATERRHTSTAPVPSLSFTTSLPPPQTIHRAIDQAVLPCCQIIQRACLFPKIHHFFPSGFITSTNSELYLSSHFLSRMFIITVTT